MPQAWLTQVGGASLPVFVGGNVLDTWRAGLCSLCQRLRGEVVPHAAGPVLFCRGSSDGESCMCQAFRRKAILGSQYR